MQQRALKPKTCRQCKREYAPRSALQQVCTLECALEQSRTKRGKIEAKLRREAERQERADRAYRKAKVKTRSEWTKEAQAAFNRYIRERDSHLNCISCGQPPTIGQRHASHYRSTAAAPQLRFNVYNVNSSCAQCNNHKSGNIVEYRIALIKKIGLDRVEKLECTNDRISYTTPQLERIKRIFSKKAKRLKDRRDNTLR